MGKQVKIIEKGKLSRETVSEMCIQGFLNLHKNIVMKTYGETQRGQAKNNQKACKLINSQSSQQEHCKMFQLEGQNEKIPLNTGAFSIYL